MLYSRLGFDVIISKVTEFRPVSCNLVKSILKSMPSKSCDLDPMVTELVKDNIDLLLPSITSMVNQSLKEGHVPLALKTATVRPKLKKSDLDINELKNYRPISNIPLTAKVLEKIVSRQLNEHIRLNGLHDLYQSAYRQHHSTETALLKVKSDIHEALDQGFMTILLMTDLSAAFDTIDHDIISRRFNHSFGINGNALKWFESYLSGRTQRVSIGNDQSSESPLNHGVPQGSVLGPLLYCMYTNPVGGILTRHGFSHHCYADDTQAYTVLKSQQNWSETAAKISDCMKEYERWMACNKLKLNQNKFEFIIFHTCHSNFSRADFSLTLESGLFLPSSEVKNLGVILDERLTMEKHVNAVCRGCHYNLRSIGRIRRYLDDKACQSLVSSLVLSRLDYANSLLYGTLQKFLYKLQLVQNSAARMLEGSRRRDHISPVLYKLHWLPVSYRIRFKLLLICFKSLQGLAPAYLQSSIQVHQPRRELRSENEIRVAQTTIARTRSHGDQCITNAMASEWNGLPLDVRSETTCYGFKKKLKTFLFQQAYATFV